MNPRPQAPAAGTGATRMLLILCPADCADAVTACLEAHGIVGWSEITGVEGSGKTGRHRGTRAFPGVGSLILTVVPAADAARLLDEMKGFAATCSPGERIHVFRLDAEQVV